VLQPYANNAPAPQQRPSTTSRWLAVLLLIVAAALVFTVLRGRGGSSGGSGPAAEPRTITPRGDLAADEKSTVELFSEVGPSVVHITSLESRQSKLRMNVLEIPQGTGSGFIWDKSGHVVTNFHVIQNADHAEVTLSDNTVWRGEIVGVAPDKDLAILKIDAPSDRIRPIKLGTSHNLQVGQKAFAIGNPFGLDQTLTTGVISGLGREIKSVTKRPIYDVVQTDTAINPGNSGGPLLDSAGRLIGVNTAIYSPSGAYAGIGFAVPVDTVNRIIPQLITSGKVVRPGLGIHIGSDAQAQKLGIEGVLILDVPQGTAAADADLVGIRAGSGGSRWVLGDVIVGIDEKPVRTSSDLFRVLDLRKVGETVTLEVERDGKRRDVVVTLQALP
jgi:S1-C subfamily serine protease